MFGLDRPTPHQQRPVPDLYAICSRSIASAMQLAELAGLDEISEAAGEYMQQHARGH